MWSQITPILLFQACLFQILPLSEPCKNAKLEDYRLFKRATISSISIAETRWLIKFKRDFPEMTSQEFKYHYVYNHLLLQFEDLGFNRLKILMHHSGLFHQKEFNGNIQCYIMAITFWSLQNSNSQALNIFHEKSYVRLLATSLLRAAENDKKALKFEYYKRLLGIYIGIPGYFQKILAFQFHCDLGLYNKIKQVLLIVQNVIHPFKSNICFR